MKSFLSLFLSLTLALSAADVAGKWAGSYDVAMSDGDTMKGKVTLTLQQDGGAVTGTAGYDQGQMKILNGDDRHPSVSADGDVIVFQSDRTGGGGQFDLYRFTRSSGVLDQPAVLKDASDDIQPYLRWR